MFTGIIQEKVPIRSLRFDPISQACVLRIESAHPQRRNWNLGDSLALDGACLTIVELEHGADASLIAFDVSKETLGRTHWHKTFQGDHLRLKELHLEPALRMGESLGGHLVSGHVESVATVESKKAEADFAEFTLSVPRQDAISSFLIEKGSVAIDGVSLTVNRVWDETGKTCFTIYLIPHTLEKCHFGALIEGDLVNVESDLMARHFCRYQEMRA